VLIFYGPFVHPLSRKMINWAYSSLDSEHISAVNVVLFAVVEQFTWIILVKVFIVLLTYWLLDVPTGLTFKNSTFCPHSVFMCIVFISEQTATFVLCDINRLLLITVMESVYCSELTGCLKG
jgi:hypothetical protein